MALKEKNQQEVTSKEEQVMDGYELKHVVDFLRDFQMNGNTEIYDGERDAAQMDDLLARAKKRGIDLKGNEHLAGLKYIYAKLDKVNHNGDVITRNLVKKLSTIIGTPLDVDHIGKYVIGHIIDAEVDGDDIIVYGVLYKTNFKEEWGEAKKLFKSGKLATSFEIYCPRQYWIKNQHGGYTFPPEHTSFMGGAILFRSKPAEPEAKVLRTAMEHCEQRNEDYVFASEREAVITAGTEVAEPQNETLVEVTCQHCKDIFKVNPGLSQDGLFKCPKCSALVDQSGQERFPPQVMDFSFSCLGNCGSNFRILERSDAHVALQCLSCNKKYKLTLKNMPANVASKYVYVPIEVNVPCPQCRQSVRRTIIAAQANEPLKCQHCGVEFPWSLTFGKIKREVVKVEALEESQATAAKKVIRKTQKVLEEVWICPHCQEEILEKSLYNDGENWFHRPCMDKGPIELSSDKVAKLSTAQRNALEDTQFAAIGKTASGKIKRKYPIHDEAHVVAALKRVVQEEAQKSILKLGLTVESVKTNIYARAVELGMDSVIKANAEEIQTLGIQLPGEKEERDMDVKLKARLNKRFAYLRQLAATAVAAVKEEVTTLQAAVAEKDAAIAQVREEAEQRVAFYKENAAKVVARREELGDFAKDLTDEQILDEKDYQIASLQKKLADKVSSEEPAGEGSVVKGGLKPSAGEGNDVWDKLKDSLAKDVKRQK